MRFHYNISCSFEFETILSCSITRERKFLVIFPKFQIKILDLGGIVRLRQIVFKKIRVFFVNFNIAKLSKYASKQND